MTDYSDWEGWLDYAALKIQALICLADRVSLTDLEGRKELYRAIHYLNRTAADYRKYWGDPPDPFCEKHSETFCWCEEKGRIEKMEKR